MPGQSDIRAGRAYVEMYVKQSALIRGLNKASATLKDWGRKTTQFGRSMVLLAAGLSVPFAISSKTFASFSDRMAVVRAVTQATEKDFDRLNTKAKELGRTTSFTASQVAEGMISLGRGGFSPEEIDKSISGVLALARATDTELGRSAEIAAGTLRAFGLEADQMDRVVDVLTATANNSAQTLEDLGESMKYTAPIAEEFGLTLEETSKILALLANMQIKGTMAGTGLKQVMAQLANPEVIKKLRAKGVEPFQADGKNLRGVADILLDLGKAMQMMGNAERIALATDLFGKRAMGPGLKMAKADYTKLAVAIDNAGGIAKKTAKTMDDTLGGSFRMMKSAIEGTQIALGEKLTPALRALMGLITESTGKLTKFISTHGDLVVAIAASVAALGLFGTALIIVGITLKLLGVLLTIVSAGIAAISVAIGFLTTPIGIALVAIGNLGTYLSELVDVGKRQLDGFAKAFGELGQWVQQVWHGIVAAVSAGDLKLAMELATAGMRLAWTTTVIMIKDKWRQFQDWLKDAWTYVAYEIPIIAAKAWTKLKSIWHDIILELKSVWIGFASLIGDVTRDMKYAIKEKWEVAKVNAQTLYWDDQEFADKMRQQARSRVRQEKIRDKQAADVGYGAQLQDAQKEHDTLVGSLEAKRDAEIASLQKARTQEIIGRIEEYRTAVASDVEALKKARAEMGVALEKAHKISYTNVPPNIAGLPGKSPPPGGGLPPSLTTSVSGTFSGRAAALMGGANGIEKKLDKANYHHAKSFEVQEEIRDYLKQGGPTWLPSQGGPG